MLSAWQFKSSRLKVKEGSHNVYSRIMQSKAENKEGKVPLEEKKKSSTNSMDLK